jgi:hypothetical protein
MLPKAVLLKCGIEEEPLPQEAALSLEPEAGW